MGDSGEELSVTESRKLFIGSLSRDTTDDGMRHFFSRFGEVESAQVMRDKFTNESRGFGFVVFVSAEDAKVVLEQSDLLLDGRNLKPELAQPRGASRRGGPGGGGGFGGRGGERDGGYGGRGGRPGEAEKLYVGGLSYDTDDESFRKHFEQFGEVRDCVVMRDRNTRRSRGFGFVTYSDFDSLEKCLNEAQRDESMVLDGRPIGVKLAVPKDIMRAVDEEKRRTRMDGLDESQAKKIFVKGLDSSSTEDDFRGFFKRFGNVTEAFLVKDRNTKISRGFGFITFESFDSAVHVLHTRSPLVLAGKTMSVTRAQPKDGPRDSGYGGGRDSGRGGARGGYGAPPPRGGPRGGDPYYDDRRAPRGGYEDRAYDRAPRDSYEDRGYDRGAPRDSYGAPPPRGGAPRGGGYGASRGADPYARGGDSYGARADPYAAPERESYRDSRGAAGDSYSRGGRGAASYAAEPDYGYDSHHGAAAPAYESRGGASYASPASGNSRSYKAYYDDPRAAEAPPRAHVRDSGYSTGASSYESRGGYGAATNGSRGGYRDSGARGGGSRYRPY